MHLRVSIALALLATTPTLAATITVRPQIRITDLTSFRTSDGTFKVTHRDDRGSFRIGISKQEKEKRANKTGSTVGGYSCRRGPRPLCKGRNVRGSSIWL